MQATLELHAEDLELIKRQLTEIPGLVRQAIEQATAEFIAAHARIEQELNAVRDKQYAQEGEIVSIKEQLTDLSAGTDVVIARLDDMSSTLTAIDSRVGNLTGSRYERRVARSIRGRMRRTIGLAQSQVLHRDWGETDDLLLALLDDADDNGAISLEEREDLLDADIIAAGKDVTGNDAYAVIEIGVTVSSADVNRAARRARTLATAAGAQCNAIVVGSEIPDTERERATRTGVAIISITERTD